MQASCSCRVFMCFFPSLPFQHHQNPLYSTPCQPTMTWAPLYQVEVQVPGTCISTSIRYKYRYLCIRWKLIVQIFLSLTVTLSAMEEAEPAHSSYPYFNRYGHCHHHNHCHHHMNNQILSQLSILGIATIVTVIIAQYYLSHGHCHHHHPFPLRLSWSLSLSSLSSSLTFPVPLEVAAP